MSGLIFINNENEYDDLWTDFYNDKLEKVLFWYLGDIAYTSGSGENKGVVVKRINFSCENSYYCQEYTNFKGQLMIPKMITQITGYRSRNNIILNEIKRQIKCVSKEIKHE